MQFSSLVRRKHQGRFNFQLIFAVFTNEFAKTMLFYLQNDSWAKMKLGECEMKNLEREGNIIFIDVLRINFEFKDNRN